MYLLKDMIFAKLSGAGELFGIIHGIVAMTRPEEFVFIGERGNAFGNRHRGTGCR